MTRQVLFMMSDYGHDPTGTCTLLQLGTIASHLLKLRTRDCCAVHGVQGSGARRALRNGEWEVSRM